MSTRHLALALICVFLLGAGTHKSRRPADTTCADTEVTCAAGWEMPSGTGPVADDPGEAAHDTNANQLILDNSVFEPRRFISMVVESPVNADHLTLAKFPFGITITDIHCIVDPADGSGDNIQIDIEECNATADSCVAVDASTIACDNNGAEDDGTCTDCVIDAADWIALDMASAPTGTVDTLTVTVYYTITRE